MPSDKDKRADKNSKESAKDKGLYFDMYHFFSRKDVMLAIILLVALLLYALFSIGSGAPTT